MLFDTLGKLTRSETAHFTFVIMYCMYTKVSQHVWQITKQLLHWRWDVPCSFSSRYTNMHTIICTMSPLYASKIQTLWSKKTISNYLQWELPKFAVKRAGLVIEKKSCKQKHTARTECNDLQSTACVQKNSVTCTLQGVSVQYSIWGRIARPFALAKTRFCHF